MNFLIFAGIVIIVLLVAEVNRTSREFRARIAALEEEGRELKARVDELESASAPDTDSDEAM